MQTSGLPGELLSPACTELLYFIKMVNGFRRRQPEAGPVCPTACLPAYWLSRRAAPACAELHR